LKHNLDNELMSNRAKEHWTEQEDVTLRDYVEGGCDWEEVSKMFHGRRTPQACRQQWRRLQEKLTASEQERAVTRDRLGPPSVIDYEPSLLDDEDDATADYYSSNNAGSVGFGTAVARSTGTGTGSSTASTDSTAGGFGAPAAAAVSARKRGQQPTDSNTQEGLLACMFLNLEKKVTNLEKKVTNLETPLLVQRQPVARRVTKKWTEQEDAILEENVLKHSTQDPIPLNTFPTVLPGRTPHACRHHWRRLQAKRAEQERADIDNYAPSLLDEDDDDNDDEDEESCLLNNSNQEGDAAADYSNAGSVGFGTAVASSTGTGSSTAITDSTVGGFGAPEGAEASEKDSFVFGESSSSSLFTVPSSTTPGTVSFGFGKNNSSTTNATSNAALTASSGTTPDSKTTPSMVLPDEVVLLANGEEQELNLHEARCKTFKLVPDVADDDPDDTEGQTSSTMTTPKETAPPSVPSSNSFQVGWGWGLFGGKK
jgi:Myb-like DNA-binding domain